MSQRSKSSRKGEFSNPDTMTSALVKSGEIIGYLEKKLIESLFILALLSPLQPLDSLLLPAIHGCQYKK